MTWKYALQCELPNYPNKEKLRWEDIAYSNDYGVLITQMLPHNRVIDTQTKDVIAKHNIQRGD